MAACNGFRCVASSSSPMPVHAARHRPHAALLLHLRNQTTALAVAVHFVPRMRVLEFDFAARVCAGSSASRLIRSPPPLLCTTRSMAPTRERYPPPI
eukprot:3402772-Rhodomonas_salina.1